MLSNMLSILRTFYTKDFVQLPKDTWEPALLYILYISWKKQDDIWPLKSIGVTIVVDCKIIFFKYYNCTTTKTEFLNKSGKFFSPRG